MGAINNLTEGIKYNRLTSTGNKKRVGKEYKQEFICECGKVKFYYLHHIKSGYTKSCGCLNRELIQNRRTTHGMSKSRFHNIYYNIIKRCYVINNKDYKNYGGRGIKCLRNSFEEFKDDMYDSYLLHIEEHGNNTSIDRINNDGNYEPSNCKRSTSIQQNNNKRKVLYPIK